MPLSPGDEEKPQRGGSDPNVIALLSLQLLLLAFFILLNSLASYQKERVDMVLSSVNSTFDGQLVDELTNGYTGALGVLQEQPDLVSEVRRLFSSLVPITRVDETAEGRELRIDIRVDKFFNGSSSTLRVGTALLFDRFAAALRSPKFDGTPYQLELLYGHSSTEYAELASNGGALAVRRAGIMGREMIERGVPGRNVSIGLLPGYPNRVRLVLTVYDEHLRESAGDSRDRGRPAD